MFEGNAPHNVPVIVEIYTDNVNRTAPEVRVLFKKGQLGQTGSNKFLFDHVGLVEAHQPDANIDREAAAIEAGANEVETLTHEQNDDIPENAAGAKFICDRTAVARSFQMAFGQRLDGGDERNRLRPETISRTHRAAARRSRRISADA